MGHRKPESYATIHGDGLGWFLCKIGLERFLHRSSQHVSFVTSRPVGGEKISTATEEAIHFSVTARHVDAETEFRTLSRCRDCSLHPGIDCVIPGPASHELSTRPIKSKKGSRRHDG